MAKLTPRPGRKTTRRRPAPIDLAEALFRRACHLLRPTVLDHLTQRPPGQSYPVNE